MEAIFKRRTVRKFRQGEVSVADMEKMLRAAMRAPSAGNEQPWEFIVLRDKETLKKFSAFHPYSVALNTADCAVVVCGNLDREIYDTSYWEQDCSAATQNLLIQAVELGLGGAWLGIHPIEERVVGTRELLNLPERVIPLCIVALGYPADEPKPVDSYKPERVHREIWTDQA